MIHGTVKPAKHRQLDELRVRLKAQKARVRKLRIREKEIRGQWELIKELLKAQRAALAEIRRQERELTGRVIASGVPYRSILERSRLFARRSTTSTTQARPSA